MSDAANPRRQPDLYWRQLGQLKAASICIRLYRNRLARWVRAVELIKAVCSGGAIAGWVVWKDFPLVWSGIIADAQFLDAIKHVFPFARLHKAASDLTVALELLCIEAEAEWESIYAGQVANQVITDRRARLARVAMEAQHKHFPEGFEPSAKQIKVAISIAATYYANTYKPVTDGEDYDRVLQSEASP
jgi:hypothetical protein